MRRVHAAGWLTSAVLGLACRTYVAQDRSTGPDGAITGAEPMVLDGRVAVARGVVSYPGGDRVDWKVVTLPPHTTGTLVVELGWSSPRPHLQLALDVFDEWNHEVGRSSRRSEGRRSLRVERAKGRYFVRVYAVGRGDAGNYRLAMTFDAIAGPAFDWLAIPIDEPPNLPEVPADP